MSRFCLHQAVILCNLAHRLVVLARNFVTTKCGCYPPLPPCVLPFTLPHSLFLILLLPSLPPPSLQCDSEGRTAVHYAAFFGHHRSLQFLIDFACDWSPRDNLGRVPLHWAVVPLSTKCLGILLKHVQ